MTRRPPCSSLFPYTTLFRSRLRALPRSFFPRASRPAAREPPRVLPGERAAQVERSQPLLLSRRARSSAHAHVADQPPVDVHARIEHETILRLLQLVQTEHHHDTGNQRRERGVEGNAEPQRDAGDVPAQGALSFLERAAEA